MAKTFHYLRVRVLCNATEDEDLLSDIMEDLCGEERVEYTESEGHHGNPLLMFEAELKSDKEHRKLFRKMGAEAVKAMLAELDERVDDENGIYLRFDKQAAVQGKWELAQHGDVFKVSGKVETHPVDRTEAMLKTRLFLQGLFSEDKVD